MIDAASQSTMLSVSSLLAFLYANSFEIIGTACGVAGALMLALKCRFSSWAWPIWILSNVAWIAWGVSMNSWGTLVQQGVFLVINCIGTWKWTAGAVREARLAGGVQTD